MTLMDALNAYTRYSVEPENLMHAFEIVENLLDLIEDAKLAHGNDWHNVTIGDYLFMDLEEGGF